MAQELVLVPKSKYEYLISKTKNNKSFCENGQDQSEGNISSEKNNKKDTGSANQQTGGKLTALETNKKNIEYSNQQIPNKKLFVKRSFSDFEKTMPIVQKKQRKYKWIEYNV